MKQQINLYQQGLEPARQPFSAARVVQALGLVALALVVLTGLAFFYEARLKSSVEELKAGRARMNAELATLEARFPPATENPQLRAVVTAREQELALKRAFLGEISGRALGNTEGFSPMLQALAGRPWRDLWLGTIVLHGNGQVGLRGGAGHAGAVPAFIRGLSGEPAFAGREFKTLQIKRLEGGGLEFTLGTVETAK